MPTVPGIAPSAQVSVGGTPEVQVSAPVDAFGGAVGHALSGLGTAVEHAGDKIWQQAVNFQELQNKAEADRAEAEYMQKIAPLHLKFSSLEGENAVAAQPQYIKDLDSTRKQIREGLSNAAVARMYDSQTLSTMGRTIFNGAGHAGQQAKIAADKAIETKRDSARDMGAASTDDETFRLSVEKTFQANQELARSKGTPTLAADWNRRDYSAMLAGRYLRQATDGDAVAAYDKFKTDFDGGKISQEDWQRVDPAMLSRRNTGIAYSTATTTYNKSVVAGEQTRPRAEILEEAQRIVKDKYGDNPALIREVDNAVGHVYNNARSAEIDNTRRLTGVLDDAIRAGANSAYELQHNPATADAWNRIGNVQRKKYEKDFETVDKRASQAASDSEYGRIHGMLTSPEDDVVAAGMDQIIGNTNLTKWDRDKLIAEKNGILVKGMRDRDKDVYLNRAMNTARDYYQSTMKDLKIYDRNGPGANKKEYDTFHGNLGIALRDWRERAGKDATPKEIRDEIVPALFKKMSKPGEGWFGGSTEGRVYQGPPKAWIDNMQATAKEKKLEPLSQDQLRRYWIHENLEKLRKTKATGQTDAN